jgi:TonB family protein
MRLSIVTLFSIVLALFATAAPQDAGEPLLRTPSIPESELLKRVEPVYPPAALKNHIEGTVSLAAIIGKNGRIERLRVTSGHPLLTGAALRAVRQWVYRPALLNGSPIRIATEIKVTFRLDGASRPPRGAGRRII